MERLGCQGRTFNVSESDAPTVSVVICSYNGAATLGTCLEALDNQTIRHHAQIIVVDDGSQDQTAAVAGSFDVELISHDRNRGTSAARNTGILAARSAIIAFTDDDCVPRENWLEELVRCYERNEVAGVGGSVLPTRTKTFMDRYLVDNHPHAPLELNLAAGSSIMYRLGLYLLGNWSRTAEKTSRPVYSFAGANMSFRREVLDAVGLMDDRFTFGSDDERICEMVREQFPDMVLWFEPQAVVNHNYIATFRDGFRRNFAYGRGDAHYYLLERGRSWPAVFPMPIAVLLGAAVARRPRNLVLLTILLHIVLPQGVLGTLRHRRPSHLAFSFVRLFEESAHNAGLITGLIEGIFDEGSQKSR